MYTGPNVQVRQVFEQSPNAVATEILAPAIVGTAYDVYSKEFLGTAHGIADTELLWGADDVVFDHTVIGERLYNFYPAIIYATTPWGNIAIDEDKSSTGVTISKDDSYSIPNTEQLEGFCEAIIPFYSQTLATGAVKILSTDLTTVIATGASFSTSQLKQGQTVIVGDAGNAGSFIVVGTISSVGSDETKIKLAVAYSGAVSFNTIIVGSAVVGNPGSLTNLTLPNCIYDPNAAFVSNKVKPGDVVQFQSASLTGTISATITAVVNNNMIKINTVTPAGGQEDYDFYSYKTSTAAPTSTISLSTYVVKRFLGFSQNYGYSAIEPIYISATSFKVAKSDGVALLSKGDYIAIEQSPVGTTTTTSPGVLSYHLVNTVATDNTYQIYTVSDIITDDHGSIYNGSGTYTLSAWHPKVMHNIVSDFRAIRSEEQQVVKRITSAQDIVTAWCKDQTISPYNELAYATLIALGASGGQVCYGVNVNAASASLTEEYSAALEELKLIDCYTHVFCTTDGGVNALASPYVTEMSEPYEAMERRAIIVYDQNDVYLQGVDTGTIATTGVITIGGAINLATAGIAKGDIVEIYDSTGVLQSTVNVIDTPSATLPRICDTDGIDAFSGAQMTFKFLSGRKEDQAIRISALGIGDRRVKILWPGWFSATINGQAITLPPYYISSARAGMDSLLSPSQSCTNKTFALPGIANIQLGTNTYFRKSQLDEIGGGGIDICIQPTSISQVIQSRHDLTSNMDTVLDELWSVGKQADVAAKTLRAAWQPYLGKYNITQSLITFLGQVTATVIQTLVKDGIIANMTIGSIARDTTVKNQINATVTTTVFVENDYDDITMLVVA